MGIIRLYDDRMISGANDGLGVLMDTLSPEVSFLALSKPLEILADEYVL